MQLANAQSELTPLERGKHALAATTKYGANNEKLVTEYVLKRKGVENGTEAEKDLAKQQVSQQIRACEVYQKCEHVFTARDN
jgi:hypothetical protein